MIDVYVDKITETGFQYVFDVNKLISQTKQLLGNPLEKKLHQHLFRSVIFFFDLSLKNCFLVSSAFVNEIGQNLSDCAD